MSINWGIKPRNFVKKIKSHRPQFISGVPFMKKILVLGTGGTIASVKTEEGFKSSLDINEILRHAGIKLHNGYEIHTKNILNIDSTLIQPEDWEIIAKEVYSGLRDYDGIVISHGTDTLAYTSSMLSFMVQNPTKPVVITGAMKPITEPGSDAVKNLRDSLLFAMEAKIGGIFVVFNGKVMNGCRVSKINSVDVDAFKSINYPDIAYIDEGGQIKYNANIFDSYSRPRGSLKLDTQYDPRVFVLKLIPGLDSRVIDGLLDMGYKGLILESYGTGGIPYRKRNLLEKIKSISREIPVVVTTQALYGGVDLSRYEVGMKALEAGVISAKDMTKEATVTKLMWALGHTEDVDEIKQIMHTNYADEIKNISQ